MHIEGVESVEDKRSGTRNDRAVDQRRKLRRNERRAGNASIEEYGRRGSRDITTGGRCLNKNEGNTNACRTKGDAMRPWMHAPDTEFPLCCWGKYYAQWVLQTAQAASVSCSWQHLGLNEEC